VALAPDEMQWPAGRLHALPLGAEKRERICIERASPMTFLKGEALS
jgi:hypothetical protein